MPTAATGGPGDLHSLSLDVCSESSVAAAMAAVNRIAGGLDAIICNAGVELRGPLEYVSQEDLRWQFDTNVFGTHRIARAVLPDMRRRGSGRLIFISSVLGRVARPWLGAYVASKFALEGLAETLYLELRSFGIKVSLVEPGRFPSELSLRGRTASGWDPDDGPYAAGAAALGRAVAALEPAGYEPDVEAMARDIAALLADPEPPLRLPLGADAVTTTALLGPDRCGDYTRLFEGGTTPLEAGSPTAEQARQGGSWRLPPVVRDLASSSGPAILTTLMPDGHPQTHVIWVDHDGDHLLVNTEIHRRKYRNMLADPRVTLTLIDEADLHHYAEVRGRVVSFVRGQDDR
jgi:NAD(P)-dependent dehydrogenase (short-subunit alcohol dehydrogenase family)